MSGGFAPRERRPRDRWLERRIQRYGREELDPDRDALAAGRERLLERFAAAREETGTEPAVAPLAAAARDRAGSPLLARIRRAIAGHGMVPVPLRVAGATASVLLVLSGVGAGAAAASAPGGPLYDARVGLETLTLPASGSQAWLDAEVGRLDERMREATAAARRGNVGALDAAVSAYAGILRDIAASTGTGTGIPATLATALDRHERQLERLAAGERPPAAAALDGLLRDVEAVHGEAAPPGYGTSGSRPEATSPPGNAAATSPGPASSGGRGKAGAAPGNSGSAPEHRPAATHPANRHRPPTPTPSQAASLPAGYVLALEGTGTPDAAHGQQASGGWRRVHVHADDHATPRHRVDHRFAGR